MFRGEGQFERPAKPLGEQRNESVASSGAGRDGLAREVAVDVEMAQ